MYSAVLMLALTAGSDTVDFGKNRGGCYGCSGSYGCSSGCSSSRGHGHQRKSRCCGTVSYGCTGGNYGCSGYSNYGCSGYGNYGCSGSVNYGSGGSYGCAGGTIINTAPYGVQPNPMPAAPKGEPLPAPKGKAQAFAPATLIVSLPAGARLSVDGAATTSTSERRTLITPELEVGSSYVYTLRAELGTNGVQTQQVTVRGGEVTTVQFNFAAQGVASR